MRDRGPESDFAGEIAGAPSRRKRSRAADREASRRLARAGDEASVEERIARKVEARRAGRYGFRIELGAGNEEGIDAAAVSGPVLLHAAEPRRRRHDGEAVPAEQNCRRALLQPGPGSDLRGNGVRAGEKR